MYILLRYRYTERYTERDIEKERERERCIHNCAEIGGACMLICMYKRMVINLYVYRILFHTWFVGIGLLCIGVARSVCTAQRVDAPSKEQLG